MDLGWFRRAQEILRIFHDEEAGQDLVEYALVATMIALGACTTMVVVAKAINDVFLNVARKFSGYGS